MQRLSRPCLALALATAALLVFQPFVVSAQTAQPTPAKEPATISGRVTADGKPAAEVSLVLTPSEWSPQMRPVARAKTDAEGRYRLANAPPGNYYFSVVAPGFVNAEAGRAENSKNINLVAGDELKDVDFALRRGAAITGRVLDADGKPLIEQQVRIMPADPATRKDNSFQWQSYPTDDRGVYRVWGIAPGRYFVYAGRTSDDNMFHVPAQTGEHYAQTFHPSATEESQARPIEVASGGEATDVDITLGKAAKTYKVSGRVLGEDGAPLAGASVGLSTLSPDGNQMTGSIVSGKTDSRGDFVVKGLTQGRWGVWATAGELYTNAQRATYSDTTAVEVTDRDVSGVEIKLHRGASVSGVLTIEGTTDPSVLARRGELRLLAWVEPTGATSASPAPFTSTHVQMNADGTFIVTGLRPGQLTFDLDWPRPKGFSMLYVRRDGVEQLKGIELRAGEQIRNVQIAYAYGTGALSGQVQFAAGPRPAGSHFGVWVRRAGGTGLIVGGANVDSLGRFRVENLSAGEYEVQLFDYSAPAKDSGGPKLLTKQNVSVPDAGEVKVTFVVNATQTPAPAKESEP